jgi:phage tail sheath protein FI
VPEVIHPGVFVDEVPSGSKTIVGVGTSTAAFVGRAEVGPMDSPVLVTGVGELERHFGRGGDLWQAARAFFVNGGTRLFVQRIESPDAYEDGLRALEGVDEVAIVAAPGAPVAKELVEHAERTYRLAILDADQAVGIDSSYAAAYAGEGLDAAPSAFAAGAYARTPPAVPPADEDSGESGVNVVRLLADGTVRIAGARTLSSDPEWKYVNLRRYFIYLEHSIDRGTHWTVFEANGEPLWANVRGTIEDFLFNEWQSGTLVGTKPQEAFFVRCDRSTMTQNDLDEGRLICLVGVAPIRPAEFVIIRIGRWTADHRCR